MREGGKGGREEEGERRRGKERRGREEERWREKIVPLGQVIHV